MKILILMLVCGICHADVVFPDQPRLPRMEDMDINAVNPPDRYSDVHYIAVYSLDAVAIFSTVILLFSPKPTTANEIISGGSSGAAFSLGFGI